MVIFQDLYLTWTEVVLCPLPSTNQAGERVQIKIKLKCAMKYVTQNSSLEQNTDDFSFYARHVFLVFLFSGLSY